VTGLDAISALAADDLAASPLLSVPPGGQGVSSMSFSDLLMQGIGQVDADLLRVQDEIRMAAAGEGADLHRVMVSLEETRLAFQVVLQVRGKLLEAYQDIMRMQV